MVQIFNSLRKADFVKSSTFLKYVLRSLIAITKRRSTSIMYLRFLIQCELMKLQKETMLVTLG